MSDGNTPVDGLAERAGAVVKAAIHWRWERVGGERLTSAEWELLTAVIAYGDQYKGVSS